MTCFIIQVLSRFEDKFIELFYAAHPYPPVCRLYFPKRVTFQRKNKKISKKFIPFFPGYIFAVIDNSKNYFTELASLSQMKNFYRFLPSNSYITPLTGSDLELANHFINNASELVKVSKVYFNADDRIVVLSGALKGFEGNIIKVDRRKKRAKVKLDLCGKSFLFDLSFELLNPHNQI